MAPLNQILFMHNGALGDCVLAFHLARRIATTWPNARIVMAVRSPIAHWAAKHGFIAEAHSLDAVGAICWHSVDSRPSEESIQFLRGFDCIVSMLGGPDELVTHRLRELSERPVYAIDPSPTPGETSHIVDQWADQLRDEGFPVAEQVSSHGRARDGRVCEITPLCPPLVRGETMAIFHPGSGGLRKVLPIEEIERLADIVRARGMSVVWMIGPDEMERDGEAFIKRLSRTAQVIAEEDIVKAADLVAGADEFIGFDAGMTHVAAMAGVPTTVIFGPTDPRVWRPLGPQVRIADFHNAAKVLERKRVHSNSTVRAN